MYDPEAPFGLEPLGLELGAERLMAERKRRGQVLTSLRKEIENDCKTDQGNGD
jgi:hypothetical protein